VPVKFIEPLQGNETALGYDLYSNQIRREAIDKARDTGEVATTARINLVQAGTDKFGLLAFMPIYRAGLPHQTLNERRLNITGYVLAVFNCDDIVMAAINANNRGKLGYRLLDDSAPVGEQLLFSNRSDAAKPKLNAEKGLFGGNNSLTSVANFKVGGRQWRFEIVPRPEYFAYHRFNSTALFLLIGLSLTGMVGALGLVSSGRTRLLRQLVDERTQSLAQSEERFRSTFEAAPIGVTNSSLAGHLLEVNQGYCEFLGYSRDELLKMTYKQVTAPEFQQSDIEMIGKLLAGEISEFNHEKQYLRKNGERVWGHLWVKLIRDSHGLPDHCIGVIENIERRKQAEASAGMLLLAVEQSPVSVVITNLDANIEYVNEAFIRKSGYSRDEIIGRNLRFMQSGKTAKATYVELWAALTNGDVWKGELINKRKDGEEYFESALITAVRELDGSVSHYLGIEEDITERKKSEAANRELLNRLNQIANSVPGVMFQYRLRPDGSSCFPYASEAIRDTFRVAPDEIKEDASAVFAILHPEDFDGVVVSIRQSAERLELWQHEFRVRFADGAERWLYGNALPKAEEEGFILWHGFITDITERKLLERKLVESSLEIQDLYNHAPCGYHSIDQAGLIQRINDTELEWLGCTREELIGKKLTDFLGFEGKEQFKKRYPQFLATGNIENFEFDLHNKNGDIRQVSSSATAIKDADGNFLRSRSVLYDITELKQTQNELRLLTIEQEAMLNNDLVGIVKLRNRTAIWINKGMERIFGYDAGEMDGKPSRILYPDDAAYQAFGAAAYLVLNAQGIYRTQTEFIRKDGRKIWVDVSGVQLTNNSAESMWMMIDITQMKTHQQEVERMAFHDVLTDLPNRFLVADRLKQALAQAERANQSLAVCYLDLDGFKPINDQYGHAAGDKLLIEIAQRMQASVRANDTVGRLGGDEFVLLLTTLESLDEYQLALQRVIQSINEPILIDDSTVVSVGASIGVTLFPSDSDDPDILLRHADQAMYQAKKSGRNRVCLYEAF
jgi:diguanylate cyclase (GGDEF)-like protein/PAS domain S-box-containing protein